VCVVATAQLYAGGFQLNEHGARALAQAGAFAARATDGSAIFFNPAGLGFQTRASAYLGTTMIFPSTKFYGPLQLNTNTEWKMESLFFTPINAYGVVPITDDLVVGLGINNPYGLGTKWPETWDGRFITTEVELQTFYFTPTASYRILENLSVGAGFNYVTGDVTIKRKVPVPSVATPAEPGVNLDLSGNGMGWNVGVLYKPLPELSVGASYRSVVKIDADGDAAFSPNYAALGLPQGPASASLELPATAFIGVAYKVMENLELEADYQFIGWSSYDTLKITFQSNGSSSASPKKYNDTYILRFGGEYTIDQLHIRAGYFFDHSPVETEYVEPLLPDANRNGLNLGFGYEFDEHFTVDVAYMLLMFDERKAENTIPETSFDGTYQTTVNMLGVNIGYNF
jgi:long-chain fatty acid transport protein